MASGESVPATDRSDYVGEHVWIAGQDFHSGIWTSECSCGWDKDDLADENAALDAWENHCDVVFMEATGG